MTAIVERWYPLCDTGFSPFLFNYNATSRVPFFFWNGSNFILEVFKLPQILFHLRTVKDDFGITSFGFERLIIVTLPSHRELPSLATGVFDQSNRSFYKFDTTVKRAWQPFCVSSFLPLLRDNDIRSRIPFLNWDGQEFIV